MAIHKLHIDEFDEIDYELIAIHTSLEDYRLAYYINQQLPVLLKKSDDEIEISIKEGSTHFSRYIFEDSQKDIQWDLIQNKNEVAYQRTQNPQDLFGNSNLEIATKVYLLPELKKVDYFLKIENAEQSTAFITNAIKNIDRVSTVYNIDSHQVKSKNNLIF